MQTETLTEKSVEELIAELYQTEEKAEIINGEVVKFMSTGGDPGFAGDVIFASLFDYSRKNKLGRAVGDNKAFLVDLPNRKSFSPDAAFHIGENPGMKFYRGAPVFAVEVRSEGDYGPKAERAMAKKRAEYFAAGTQVVWDVDLLSDDVIRVYRASDPDNAQVYRRGETAEAEPAVPGWTMAVDDLFVE